MPFRAFIYGRDEGFRRLSSTSQRLNVAQDITMPVYGVVHGVGQNGFLTVLADGKHYAEMLAYPGGVSTDFYWITAEYHYRYEYFQPTSESMDGFNAYQPERNRFDIKQEIIFLTEERADYVGMGKAYQQYLLENGELSRSRDEVDIRLEFLGGEIERGLLWDSVLAMTTLENLERHVIELKGRGVSAMHVIYRGWSKGGLTGTLPSKFPFEKKARESKRC